MSGLSPAKGSRNPNPKNIVTVENIQRIKLTAYGEDSSASIGIQL
jgi:hypothetical protein